MNENKKKSSLSVKYIVIHNLKYTYTHTHCLFAAADSSDKNEFNIYMYEVPSNEQNKK